MNLAGVFLLEMAHWSSQSPVAYVQLYYSARGIQCGAVANGGKWLNVYNGYVGESLVMLNIATLLLGFYYFTLITLCSHFNVHMYSCPSNIHPLSKPLLLRRSRGGQDLSQLTLGPSIMSELIREYLHFWMPNSLNMEPKHTLKEIVRPGSYEHVTTTCISHDFLLTGMIMTF